VASAPYAVPLAAAGLDVVACDLMPNYVERTRRRAREAGVALDARVADAFEFVPDAPCQAAINLGTSFGYGDDGRNVEMLRRTCDALHPGGWFALEFMNLPGVLRRFQPRMVDRLQRPEGELELIRDTEIDFVHGLVRKRWTWRRVQEDHAPASAQHDTRVRAYFPWDLVRLVEHAGLEFVRHQGDLAGKPLELDDLRCVVIARKPE
jgi:hypothetical protein